MWNPLLYEGEFLSTDLSPSLSNTLTIEQAGIDIDEGVNDLTFSFSGLCIQGTADNNISKGDLVSKTSTGWSLADTTSSTKKIGHGLALEDKNSGEDILILLQGNYRDNSKSFLSTLFYANDENLSTTPSSSFIQLVAKKTRTSIDPATQDCLFFDPDFLIGGSL
tara:strand:- start:323 stop:817 length:495 start_codon:yes stop_codon:yes gene_type:complete